MGIRLSDEQREHYQACVALVLDEYIRKRETLTYLALADAVAMPGPQRIHRVTRLLERLMKEDVEAGRPVRAAVVISRVGSGLPAEGFFDRARRLGLFDGCDPGAFHKELLARLFDSPD